MRRFFLVIAAAFLAFAVAPAALAGTDAQVAAVDLVAVGRHSFALRSPAPRFTLAGVHWRGSGHVVFRTRSVGGRWSAWHPAAPEDDDGPDAYSREAGAGSWRVGNPWWVGTSDGIEARAVGRVVRVRAYLVWSPETRVPYRMPAATGTPSIVPRLSWSADESIRRAPPTYAPDVRFAIIHHTAGRNDYTRAEAPAIVRGIELYHVQGNGWNDIGYNFLVDRFGTIYEGRYGGIDRNVVGAHARGFNTGSVGIALLGTYGTTTPSAAAQEAIARLLAWRLDLAHVDPTGFLSVISGGNDRFPAGVPVLLAAVSGHRDTDYTECPGDQLYARLGAIAATARGIGGQKIFDPAVDEVESSVRVQSALAQEGSWTVTITSASGEVIAQGSGTGKAVGWTWDSRGAPSGSYTWTITAGAARPATGVVNAGGAATLEIENAVAEPEAISPNGDGQAETSLLTYRISGSANVTVEVTDSAGAVVATPVDRVWTRSGTHDAVIEGDDLADGRYGVVVTARTAAGELAQHVVPLIVSRTLGLVGVTPAVFSPNSDGRRDRLVVTFALAAPADVRIRIERDGRWVASPLARSFLPGQHRFVWDGARGAGPLRDGSYEARVEALDGTGEISYSLPFTSDTSPPRVLVLPGPRIRVQVSEPATLALRIDGTVVRREVRRAGIVRLPWSGPAARVRVVAWDAAGNSSGPVVRARASG